MLPFHEMFEGNVTNDSNVVVCLTNAEGGTAARDLSVYLKNSNLWQLNLGEHLPRCEQQEGCNDLQIPHLVGRRSRQLVLIPFSRAGL